MVPKPQGLGIMVHGSGVMGYGLKFRGWGLPCPSTLSDFFTEGEVDPLPKPEHVTPSP